ncbi:MAG: GNAT family N-acetyltransferase [Opitutales bacterium]|jgi:GNAT superfamily N-acetyltransferase|nr:GNAT family N-acetyltransferase [Opitutales bacterium]MDG2167690.1 GNAT family N-acetyltransferase [Opitutales bacterium]
MSLEIRKSTRDDVGTILGLIYKLAEYEELTDMVTATEEQLQETMFCEQPYAHCQLAFWNGEPVAYALYFFNYSTFLAQPGLYLEDLFVVPENRGNGIGKEMLLSLAREAKERNCGRMEWMALDWNTRAHDFYLNLGAKMLEEWKLFRATGESLDKLASL